MSLKSGRYLVLVLSGQIGGITDAEKKAHADPGVLEFLTVKKPAG